MRRSPTGSWRTSTWPCPSVRLLPGAGGGGGAVGRGRGAAEDAQWVDLLPAPGQPAVGVGLAPSARPPQDATVTAGPVTASPGDHLLHAVAARLLAKAGPDGFPLRDSAPRPGPLAPGTGGVGHVIAPLPAAAAPSPPSPAPGQFAALRG